MNSRSGKKPLRLLPLTLLLAVGLACPALADVALHKVGDFNAPVYVTGAPGDYEHLYVVEQQGTVQVVQGGARTLFADLRGQVMSGGEQGLLSLAFAPDFQQSRLLYVYFTNKEGDNEIDELRADSADRIDPESRRRVLLLSHPFSTAHNGGQLQFGPDGYLYVGTGDGGTGPGPQNNAQNLESPLGKLLRLDPRGGIPYAVPSDNPYVGQPGDDLIWAYGLRNPFRFSFDRSTGDLAIGDVGEATTEEIDFAPAAAGAGRGVDFGWSLCEGSYTTNTTSAPCQAGTLPVLDRFHSDGWCSITGGYVVRDPSLPSLLGRYVYGDLCQPRLHSADLRTPQAASHGPLGVEVEALASFGEDSAGCIYAASIYGAVYRLVETSFEVPCAQPSETPPPADETPPVLQVRVRPRQDLSRQGGAIADASCDEPCTVTVAARFHAGGRAYRLPEAEKSTSANTPVRLRARSTRRTRRVLRRQGGGKVRLALRARDLAGNASPLVRRSVRTR